MTGRIPAITSTLCRWTRCPDMPVLSLDNVIGARGADFQVSVDRFSVEPGEAVALVGQSGSGKSTILDMLAGVLKPLSAQRFQLSVGGEETDIAALWQRDDQSHLRRVRAQYLGYVLQTGGLAPFLTIAENVALPFWRDGRRDDARVTGMLEALEIGAYGNHLPRDVSVGQRQRAAIARALVTTPAVVLADEPTAALDADSADMAMALLVRIAKENGSALVVVTHDRPLVDRHDLRVVTCARAGPGRSALGLAA